MAAWLRSVGLLPYELFHTYWALFGQGGTTRAAELGPTIV